MSPIKTILVSLSIALCALLMGFGIYSSITPDFDTHPSSFISTVKNAVESVLGMGTGRYTRGSLVLRATDDAWGRGGLIPIPVTDEPAIDVDFYGLKSSTDVTFDLYSARQEDILRYLVHNNEGNQTSADTNVQSLTKVGTFSEIFQPSNINTRRITLPIGESQTGIWLLRATYNSLSTDVYIIRTDFGVFAKEENNALLFWAQDFKSKRSLGSAQISLYSLLDGVTKISDVSISGDGIAKLPMPPDADIALVKNNDQFAIVPLNLKYLNISYRYQSFLPKEKEYKYFVFTDRPIYKPGDTVYYKAIIRDDDDARYTIPTGKASVVVQKDWSVKDPIVNTTVPISTDGTISGEFVIPKEKGVGYYEITVQIGEKKQGYGPWVDNSASFRVEEYRKPEYHITASVDGSEFVTGDALSYVVTGSYFSGQPLSGSVKYRILSSETYEPQYAGDRSQNDGWFEYGSWYGETIDEGSVQFTGGGLASGSLLLPYPKTGKTRIFTIEAEYNDGSGNPAFAKKSVLVRPAEFSLFREDSYSSGSVGKKLELPVVLTPNRDVSVSRRSLNVSVTRQYWEKDGTSEEKYPQYQKKSEEIGEFSITTGQSGRAIVSLTPQKPGSYDFEITATDDKGNELKRTFTTWVSSVSDNAVMMTNEQYLTITPDANLYEPGDTAEVLIESFIADRDVLLTVERNRVQRFYIVHMQGKQARFQLPIETTDMPNIYIVASSFSDVGADIVMQPISVSAERKRITVSIETDKPSYGPGDTVQVTVKTKNRDGAPVQAETALWAIDKALFELIDPSQSSIFSAFWSQRSFDTSSSHSLEGISVNAAEGGGCFGSDTAITMADGSKKKIQDVKPGDLIRTFSSTSNTSVVNRKVLAVSKHTEQGIIMINGFLSVTPDHYMWINGRWMEAGSIQIGDVLTHESGVMVPVETIEWVTGKTDVYNLEIAHTHTFFADGIYVHNQKGDGSGRSLFEDTAYWNPSVRTGADGTATIRFKVPDNLTTWVISAVSANPNTDVGDAKRDIIVTKRVIVRPIVPNLLRVNDQGSIGALVQNFTDSQKEFTVTLASGSLEISQSKQTAKIASNGVMEFWWNTTASKEDESARITISATAPDEEGDAVTVPLPIKNAVFLEKKGFVAEGTKDIALTRYPDTDTAKSTLTVSLSPTIIGSLPSALQSLMLYPYECSEQTATKVMAGLVSRKLPGMTDQVKQKTDGEIKKGIIRLLVLQNSDGGWGWWKEGSSLPFVSAYVAEVLMEAKKQGFDIGTDTSAKMSSYASSLLFSRTQEVLKEKEISSTLFGGIIRVLVDGKNKENLYAFEDSEIPVDILARVSYWRIQTGDKNLQSNGINELLARAVKQGDMVNWKAGDRSRFGSEDLTTATVVRAMVSGGVNTQTIIPAIRYLLVSRKSDMWSHTLSTVESVRALIAFYEATGEGNPNVSYAVLLGSETITSGTITSVLTRPEFSIPVEKISQNGTTLQIRKSGFGQLYSTVLYNQLRNAVHVLPQSQGGITIKRSYVGKDGQPQKFSLGDIVTVRLVIDGIQSSREYGVIEDHLPAGMVPVVTTLKNESLNQKKSPIVDNSRGWAMEAQSDAVLLSLFTVSPGSSTYEYSARVVAGGTYSIPPARFSLMYEPSVQANTGADTITINTKRSSGVSNLSTSWTQWIRNNEKTLFIAAIGVFGLLAATAVILFARLYGKK